MRGTTMDANSSRDERFFDAPEGPRVRFRAMRAMRFRDLVPGAVLVAILALDVWAIASGQPHRELAAASAFLALVGLAALVVDGPYRRHLDRRHAEDRADGRWADELAAMNDLRRKGADRAELRAALRSAVDSLGDPEPRTDAWYLKREGEQLIHEGDLLDALLKPSTAPPGSFVTYPIEGGSPFADDTRRNGPSAYAEGKADQGAHAALADLDSAMVTFGADLDYEPPTFATTAWSPPIMGEAFGPARGVPYAPGDPLSDAIHETLVRERYAGHVPPEYLPES